MTQRHRSGIVLLIGLLLLGWHRHSSSRMPIPSTGTQATAGSDAQASGRFSQGRRGELKKPGFARRLLDGEMPAMALTGAQVEKFLTRQGRTAESLLAASRLPAPDPDRYREEATRRFPDHPMVQADLVLHAADPEKRREALERFRKLDPENSFGDFLAASLALRDGHPEQVVQELEQVRLHSRFDPGAGIYVEQQEEAFGSAGFGTMDAKVASVFFGSSPELIAMDDLDAATDRMWKAARSAGDQDTAARILSATLESNRARGDDAPGVVLNTFVATVMQTRLLKAAAPDEIQPDGRPAAEILGELEARQESLGELPAGPTAHMRDLTDADLLGDFAKVRQSGQARAMGIFPDAPH